jgi:hypothetical protein
MSTLAVDETQVAEIDRLTHEPAGSLVERERTDEVIFCPSELSGHPAHAAQRAVDGSLARQPVGLLRQDRSSNRVFGGLAVLAAPPVQVHPSPGMSPSGRNRRWAR